MHVRKDGKEQEPCLQLSSPALGLVPAKGRGGGGAKKNAAAAWIASSLHFAHRFRIVILIVTLIVILTVIIVLSNR